MDSGGPGVIFVVVLVLVIVGIVVDGDIAVAFGCVDSGDSDVVLVVVVRAFGTTAPGIEDEFERFADQCVLRSAVQPRGWRTRHASDWWMEDCCCYSQDVLQRDKFQFH